MSFNLIEVVVMSILVAMILSFLLLSVILKAKNIKLYSVIAQLVIDKQIMSDEISKLSFMANNAPSIENDFIKFLSDSRSSAYEYIEDVQATLLELKSLVESNGSASDVDACYKKLISLLPSENSGVAE
jgi:hypothetical protein